MRRAEEVIQAAERRAAELGPAPGDPQLAERLRADTTRFFGSIPEPPLYRRAGDPARQTAEARLEEGRELLARCISAMRAPTLAAEIQPLALALRRHLEALCHVATGHLEEAEATWTAAVEAERAAASVRRLWRRSDEERPKVYDREKGTSRYDPRPEAQVRVKLSCFACHQVDEYAFSPSHATHRFTCQRCHAEFVAYFAEAQELAISEPAQGKRRHQFRLEEIGGGRTRLEFDDASGAELGVAKRDLLAFLYTGDRELKGVLNLSSSRLLWIRRGGPCFLAQAAFGEGAPELATFRAFRDEALLPTRLGTAMVRAYYLIGPHLAAPLRERPRARALLRAILRRAHRILARRGHL